MGRPQVRARVSLSPRTYASRALPRKIAFLFVRVGLSGADMGAAYLLPRIVGLAKATELLYTGDFISAEEALATGLYNRVVPAEELAVRRASLPFALRAGQRLPWR